jgi:protein O-mannosyl-transferase
LLATCAYGTYKRNEVWHSEESLWFNVTLKSPKNGRGLMNYGIIKVDEGKYAEAEAYFNKTLQLLPAYSFVFVNMGVLKERTGDNSNAESYYLNGIALGPVYPSHFFLYGQFLYHQARFIEAEVMLQKSMALSKSYLEPRQLLLKIYELLGQWDELKTLAVSTLKISPDNAGALAALECAEKRKTRADIDADNIRTAPTAEKYLALSNDYYQEGKYQQCIIAAQQAIILKPAYADAYNNVGCAYNMLEQYDRATEALQKALSINPAYELAKNNLVLAKNHQIIPGQAISNKKPTAENYIDQSLLYYNQKQYELCIAACLSALQIKPDYDLAYNNLCAAYNRLGEWDAAIETANKGLKINPNNERIKNNLAGAINGKKLNQKK